MVGVIGVVMVARWALMVCALARCKVVERRWMQWWYMAICSSCVGRVAVSCWRNCNSVSPKRPCASNTIGVMGCGWYLVRLWSSASVLAWPGVTVALVAPAKVAAVVAEVTITSKWIGSVAEECDV